MKIASPTIPHRSTVLEGRLKVDPAGHEVYYRLFGSGSQTLIGLHGGPGGSQGSIRRLSEVANDQLQVLLYDQLGGGLSDRPDDLSLWTVKRFVAELDTVRTSLDLGPVHLFGRSWGGMLALQYALDHPSGVRSLILSNTAASVPEIARAMHRMRSELGAEKFATLLQYEATGEYTHPRYLEVVSELLARHYRRVAPFDLEASIAAVRRDVLPALGDHGPSFEVMWGPNEFHCTGSLRDWDVTARLAEIRVPTLILCGLHDEIPVELHQKLADCIRDNEFVIFGNSSHNPLFEREAENYLGVVKDFLSRTISSR